MPQTLIGFLVAFAAYFAFASIYFFLTPNRVEKLALFILFLMAIIGVMHGIRAGYGWWALGGLVVGVIVVCCNIWMDEQEIKQAKGKDADPVHPST